MNCVSVLGGDEISMVAAGAQGGKLVLWNSEGKFLSAIQPSERSVNAILFDNSGEAEEEVKVSDY